MKKMKRKIDKKRVNLYLTEEAKKELDLQTEKYGMSYGVYLTYLLLKEQETEEREKQALKAWKDNTKIWI